ncbi:MAG: NAD-binding protein [Candidatus Thorarchaeota archaeon]
MNENINDICKEEDQSDLIKLLVSEDIYGTDGEEQIESSLKLSKRFKRSWKNFDFLIGLLAGIIGFIFGYIGFYYYFLAKSEAATPIVILYHTLRLFVNEVSENPPFNWGLYVAMILCPLALYYSFIIAFLHIFNTKIEKIQLMWYRKHTIICGLNKWSSELLTDLRKKKKKVVIIESEPVNEFAEKARDLDVVILNGRCADPYMLYKAKVHKAKNLVIFTENDTLNMEVAINTQRLFNERIKKGKMKNKKHNLKCFVHIGDKKLYDVFSEHHIFEESVENVNYELFNVFYNAARVLFLTFPFEKAKERLKNDKIHILIVGFGQLGECVTLQAIKMCHYSGNESAKITILKEKEREKKEPEISGEDLKDRFCYKYNQIKNLKTSLDLKSFDISFNVIDFDNLKNFQETVNEINKQESITTIVVCLEEELKAVKFSIDLISIIEEKRIPIKYNLPINIYVDQNEDIFKFPKKEETTLCEISPFGILKYSCSSEAIIKEKLDQLAKMVHLVWNEEKKENADTLWNKAIPVDKESSRQQADHLPIKLRELKLQPISKKRVNVKDEEYQKRVVKEIKDEQVKNLARMEHNRWCAERWVAGWKLTTEELLREYIGDEILKKSSEKELKDLKKKHKISDLLIPFESLDDDDIEIDLRFIRNIPRMLEDLDLVLLKIQ